MELIDFVGCHFLYNMAFMLLGVLPLVSNISEVTSFCSPFAPLTIDTWFLS